MASEADFQVQIPAAGGYDKLQLVPLEDTCGATGANVRMREIPKEERVSVRVLASGVNYADVCIRWGLYESAKRFVGWPITPGFEFAGVVDEVGSRASRFKPGDKVCGVTLFGAYSTKVDVPEWQLFVLPHGLSFDSAASLLCVFLTAYYAAAELAHVRKGDTVLVHSASGGVGSQLVQICRILGARVVGVVGRAHKVDLARDCGCSVVIDKSADDLWATARREAPDGFDVIFDANGVATLGGSWAALAPGGKVVVYGFHTMLPRHGGVLGVLEWAKLAVAYLRTPRFNPLEMTSSNRSVMAFNLSFMFDKVEVLERAMSDLHRWLEDGVLAPPPVTRYPMERVADAHRDIESGLTVGKLVMVTAEGRALGDGLAPNCDSARALPRL